VNNSKFWRLQKAANLSNREAAKYLDVSLRSIVKWRTDYEPPRAVILAMEALVREQGDEHRA